MKKIGLFALALVLTLSLVACGRDNKNETTTPTTLPTTAPTTTPTTEPTTTPTTVPTTEPDTDGSIPDPNIIGNTEATSGAEGIVNGTEDILNKAMR